MIPANHIIKTISTRHGTYHASLFKRLDGQMLEPIICTMQFDKEGFATKEAAIDAVTEKYQEINNAI